MTIIKIHGTAGAGKSQSILNAIKEFKLEDYNITTFRRTMANDLRFMISENLQIHRRNPILKQNVNTIHGICLKLYNDNYEKKEVVNQNHLKKINKELNLNFGNVNQPTGAVTISSAYSWLRNTKNNNIKSYPWLKNLKISTPALVNAINHYNELKVEMGLIDFTDMLTTIDDYKLFPKVKVLAVDEYQDLSPLQHDIVEMWSGNINHTIIAGDPNQSIMKFMGGSPDFFNGVKADDSYVLPKTFRCGNEIWERAEKVLKRNRIEFPEVTGADHVGQVKEIYWRNYINSPLMWEGSSTNTVFHLFRTNYMAIAFVNDLQKKGIIYKGIYGWTDEEIELFNVLNSYKNELWKFWTSKSIQTLVKYYPKKYFNYIGTKKKLLMDLAENKLSSMACTSILNSSLLKLITSREPTKNKKINRALKVNKKTINQSDIYTTVLTIHGSKGGQADTVFLHNGITSRVKKGMQSDSKEEARVFFVGATRAKHNLYIVQDKGSKYNI